MSLILSGTDGLSDVDGTAATPAIRGTDANTGIFFPAADTIAFSEGGVEAARINSSGQFDLVNNPVLTGGTANGVAYLNGSKVLTTGSALVFDGSNLGIGTTSPSDTIGYGRALDIQSTTGAAIYLRDSDNPTTQYAAIAFDGNASVNNLNIINSSSTGPIRLFTNGAERARIDSSGNLLVGTTSAGDGKVRISASANAFNLLKIDDTGSTGGNFVQFLNSSGAQAGSINHNGTTSVNYGSGSDYRLKDITGPVTNAADFINSLKPKVGTWKADGSKFVGFLAHEFAEVCPQAVVGEKDGVDADGNPIYQSMEASSSEVIANMVSLLQEQQAIIQSLTARITALENK